MRFTGVHTAYSHPLARLAPISALLHHARNLSAGQRFAAEYVCEQR